MKKQNEGNIKKYKNNCMKNEKGGKIKKKKRYRIKK